MDDPKPSANLRLIIPAEVQETLEKRLILVEDIQQVIEYGRKDRRAPAE